MLYWVAIATTFRVWVVNMDHSTTYSNYRYHTCLSHAAIYNETFSLVFSYITNIIAEFTTIFLRSFSCRKSVTAMKFRIVMRQKLL